MLTDPVIAQYRELERKLRHIIENKIRMNPETYLCLDYRHHSKVESSFQKQKYRFGILPRENVSPSGNGHNFNCGHCRIELFLGGHFNKEGFFQPHNSQRTSYRWVFCPSVCADSFIYSLLESFELYWPVGKKSLCSGDYEGFVQNVLDIVNDNLLILKEMARNRYSFFTT